MTSRSFLCANIRKLYDMAKIILTATGCVSKDGPAAGHQKLPDTPKEGGENSPQISPKSTFLSPPPKPDKNVLIVDKSVLFRDNFGPFSKMALYYWRAKKGVCRHGDGHHRKNKLNYQPKNRKHYGEKCISNSIHRSCRHRCRCKRPGWRHRPRPAQKSCQGEERAGTNRQPVQDDTRRQPVPTHPVGADPGCIG